MSKVFQFLFGCFLLAPGTVLAQSAGETATYVRMVSANDMYYLPRKTDMYFTNGVSLEVGRQRWRAPRLLATGQRRLTSYLRLTQHIFTPALITASELTYGDRPFASYLHLTWGRELLNDHFGFRLRYAATAGVLGRPSMGGKAQNWFHRQVPWADELPGWHNEVRTDVVLNARLRLEKIVARNRRTGLALGTDARLGTLYTDLAATGRAYWRVLNSRDRRRRLVLEATGRLRAVGYNATLSGGLLNRDARFRGVVRPERLVWHGGFGGQLAFQRLRLGTGVRYLGAEFRGGDPHVWAYWSCQFWLTGARRYTRP